MTIRTKSEIVENLQKIFTETTDFLNNINEQQFVQAPEGKWSSGQQTLHLIRSVKPVAVLMQGDIAQVEAFGKLKREPWDYETLVKNYLNLLNTGAKAPKPFDPKEIRPEDKTALITKFTEVNNFLIQTLDQWDEDKLDQYCIPHPLLGNFSIREMMFFTIYHTGHHLKFMKEYASVVV
ncbi:hypothetical protein BKI52_05125 [marine bacterium AO1-C]|nr:hypothetical protein BKI52_05125 [marine bacterium AO1-C]